MKQKDGEKILNELFEGSGWKEKYKDQIPADENGILYKWSADEAEYASPFFSRAGQSILTEETCVAKRCLYLGRESDNSLHLYVCEQEKDSFRKEIPEMAREFASMMKVDNIMKDKD
ncbi:MAG: hypothetical protein R6X11_01855 [Desulfonatronovibrio sp.]